MVKKRIKSRRITTRKKKRIEKKVNAHHRKVSRLAKRLKRHRKLHRDPGVPNLYPEKMKLLQSIQNQRIRKKLEVEEQRLEKQRKINSEIVYKSKQDELLQLELNARQKLSDHRMQQELLQETAMAVSVLPSNQATKFEQQTRRFYKDFRHVVDASDVIIFVLDARDPLGCRSRVIEKQVMSSDPNKRILLLLNKIDLVPQEVVQKWLEYLRLEFPTFPFKSNTQKQRSRLGRVNFKGDINYAPAHLRFGGKCLGREQLVQVLKNYCRLNQGGKRSITVGVIGFPNVGKSSVINSLRGKRVANVGARPGITTQNQTFRYDKDIQFVDCPGIIFPKKRSIDVDVMLRGCVEIEKLDDPITPVEMIRRRCTNERLMKHYGLPFFKTTEEFLARICDKRGMIVKGGLPNLNSAARVVLRDWSQGKIPFFTLPPNQQPKFINEGYNDKVEWGMVDDNSVLKKIRSLRDKEADEMIPMISSLSMD